ncbi:MAG: glucuronate isomerase [Verrucomicrobiae bacterium]|nr:glucuronate isomerase [Verrucomicrobiae bacterium]
MKTSKTSGRFNLDAAVDRAVAETWTHDIHTHLYDPAFGKLFLWGIDELLVYHYLVSEAFRYFDMSYDSFWKLPKSRQAGLIWDELFIKHSPISEACRGLITSLNVMGLDVGKRDLPALRKWFAAQDLHDYIDRVLEVSRIKTLYMTNSPFDDAERPVWEKGFKWDSRFQAALRIDPLLLDWPSAWKKLKDWGYKTGPDLTAPVIGEVRRFLDDWTDRINARYLMVSLPPDFEYPSKIPSGQLVEKAVLPHCLERNMPFAMMGGVKKLLNPQLRLAGDAVGFVDTRAYENLLASHPRNKFLVTMLARENQHELCVLARKFRNLHVFGCWWFTNIPLCIEEITRLRIELIGLSVTPQHSDARVFDQLTYKWNHSRRIISKVLKEKYHDLEKAGWVAAEKEIQRDVAGLFGGAFDAFMAGKL